MANISEKKRREIAESLTLFISHPTGKMAGIPAISESCVCNEFCAAMHKRVGTICSHCYAQESLAFKQAARLRYSRNTEIMSQGEIPWDDLPRIYSDIFRLETHGDWVNLQSAINEIRIAEKNPQVEFTVWTKRINLLRQLARNGYTKPDNFHIKVSSPYLDRELSQSVKEYLSTHGWTVSYFTVMSLQGLQDKYGLAYLQKAGDKVITCGGRNCRACMRCYGNHPMEDVVELLKQDVPKAKRLGVKMGGEEGSAK